MQLLTSVFAITSKFDGLTQGRNPKVNATERDGSRRMTCNIQSFQRWNRMLTQKQGANQLHSTKKGHSTAERSENLFKSKRNTL